MKNIILGILTLMVTLASCSESSEDSLDSNPPDIIGSSESWSTFRGNSSNTGYTTNASPIELPTLKWRFTPPMYPGDGSNPSSPIIYNGNVYYTSYSGDLFALNMITGQENWKLKIYEDKNIDIYLTEPTVLDETAFIGVSNDGSKYDLLLCAVDISKGQKKWEFNTIGGVISIPKTNGEIVYFATDKGYIYAVDVNTGIEKWKKHIENDCSKCYFADITLANETLLLLSGDHDEEVLFALDMNTGQEKWTKEDFGGSTSYNTAVMNGVVFVGGGRYLYALDVNTGQEKWVFASEVTKSYLSIDSPALAYGTAYFLDAYDNLYAVDANTGLELWKFEVNSNYIDGTVPVIANGLVYFSVIEKGIFAIDAYTGTKKWQYYSNTVDADAFGELAISDGGIYFSNDFNIIALE